MLEEGLLAPCLIAYTAINPYSASSAKSLPERRFTAYKFSPFKSWTKFGLNFKGLFPCFLGAIASDKAPLHGAVNGRPGTLR